MKRFIPAIVIVALIIWPSIGLPSYLIELKNGVQFITNQYWEEGAQIKFYYSGGIVGVAKDLVKEINESDLPQKEEVVQPKSSQELKTGDKKPVLKTDEKREDKSEDIKIEHYIQAKKEIMEKYMTAKNKRNQAIKNRDNRAKMDAIKEEKALYKKLMDLSRELKAKNNGVLPKWWVEGITP